MAEMTQKYVLCNCKGNGCFCLNVNRLNIFFEAQDDFLSGIVKNIIITVV